MSQIKVCSGTIDRSGHCSSCGNYQGYIEENNQYSVVKGSVNSSNTGRRCGRTLWWSKEYGRWVGWKT